MRCGKWHAYACAKDNRYRRSELDREATGRRDLRDLYTDRGDNFVAVQRETDDNAKATHGKYPVAVIPKFFSMANFAVHVDHVDGREGSRGIGYVVRAMAKGVADGGHYLQILEYLLHAVVKHLCIPVHL